MSNKQSLHGGLRYNAIKRKTNRNFMIGRAVRKLHGLKGYSIKSPFTQSKKRFYEWFRDRSFVKEFDAILDNIPAFEQSDQCFVHTDIGPHNTILSKDGKVMFVDLDDAGIGSRYLDLGWPFNFMKV